MYLPVVLLLSSYLLGSLSGSLMLGRLRGVDIRTQGSGNAGGTNALRTQGFVFALATVLIDVGKGALAAWLAASFLGAALQPAWVFACILAAAVGHIWPIFHGFRGGKGAATLVGGLAVAWPQAIVPVLATWLLCLLLTGYVGLSTVLAGVAVLAFALITNAQPSVSMFAAALALLLVFTHRGNLARLRQGREPRFERARVLGRLLFGKKA